MEEKLKVINIILENLKKETERKKLKDEEEKKKKTAEWRLKVRMKDRKEKLEIEKRVANHWAMINWVTNFIKENEEEWDLVRASKLKEANRELEEWKKLKRLEKIKLLQRKWDTDNGKEENNEKENVIDERMWTVWRKKENPTENKTKENDRIEENSKEVVTPQHIALSNQHPNPTSST